jgi:hypothetical protein
MPREQIIFPRLSHDAPEGSRSVPRFPIPHVCWHGAPDSGGWVQLMFEVDRPFLERLLADHGDKDQDVIEIHSEVLDRNATNRLIKHTRRARNAAYGADE